MTLQRPFPHSMYRQSGVIAYRAAPSGGIEVLLISSRRRKRWVIPKGIVEGHLTAAQSAANEALEEAGVAGAVSDGPVGEYTYQKWGGTCRVKVFLMRVDEVHDTWLESTFRERRWLDPAEAAGMVDEQELGALLARAAELAAEGG